MWRSLCTKLTVLFLFFIIAVSGVSEDIDQRIYLSEYIHRYIRVLEVEKRVNSYLAGQSTSLCASSRVQSNKPCIFFLGFSVASDK